jgi:diaminohydroxyphosphoribosylaminopyrimidine deaminase/5-amino-6-(5-phosphoribosylamino)uracil reductase
VEALRAAEEPVRGATAYVTLEPCCHFGKTPPCTEALIDSGIGRVIAAMEDPSEHVGGGGFRRLRGAGIEARSGCLESEARRLNAPFLTLSEKGRPYIILKWAQSLNGHLITPPGHPKAISGPPARRWVHRLRARVDAILVGIGTVLDDDPSLTARGVQIRRVATRVVLDSRLRIPLRSQLVESAHGVSTLVITTREAAKRRRRHADRLQSAGVELELARSDRSRVNIADALARLAARSMTNVLIEGGPEILSECLRRGLADEAFIFIAPRVIGGAAKAVLFPTDTPADVGITKTRVGADTLCHVHFPTCSRTARP